MIKIVWMSFSYYFSIWIILGVSSLTLYSACISSFGNPSLSSCTSWSYFLQPASSSHLAHYAHLPMPWTLCIISCTLCSSCSIFLLAHNLHILLIFPDHAKWCSSFSLSSSYTPCSLLWLYSFCSSCSFVYLAQPTHFAQPAHFLPILQALLVLLTLLVLTFLHILLPT